MTRQHETDWYDRLREMAECCASRVVGGGELRKTQVGVLGRDRLEVVQAQGAECWVVEHLGAEVTGQDLVLGPQRPEALALALERVDQPSEAGVPDASRVLGAEAGERRARGVVPLRATRRGAREQPPQEVRRAVGRGGRDSEQAGRCPVPREDVRPRTEQLGRVWDERVDERAQLGRRLVRLDPVGQRQLDAREVEEMRTFAAVELEHTRNGVEHPGGRLDLAALLQPRVPRESDAGELRDLLAPQPRRAASAAALDAGALGCHLRATLTQEVGELGAACL
jgi:hypothetical protein